jgi:Phospholipase_D-nuclease N-terminal
MPVTTNPFVEMLWAVLIACLWVAWLALLFVVIGDIFRRRDLSGRVKTAWSVVAILLPFLGVFAYMATQKDGMTERKLARAAAKELEKAEFLGDIGAITQVEFDAVKRKPPTTRLA